MSGWTPHVLNVAAAADAYDLEVERVLEGQGVDLHGFLVSDFLAAVQWSTDEGRLYDLNTVAMAHGACRRVAAALLNAGIVERKQGRVPGGQVVSWWELAPGAELPTRREVASTQVPERLEGMTPRAYRPPDRQKANKWRQGRPRTLDIGRLLGVHYRSAE